MSSSRAPLSATFCLALAAASAHAASVPFWGAREPRQPFTPPADLKPGEFTWWAAGIPAGPVTVLVSVSDQRAHVYRNGIEVGISTVSTGRHGFETPTGVFTVLQKDRDHRSKTYNNAPMPYTERLTWSGVALHAGGLPGYPSSHGCVHLPTEFARRLFEISPIGMTVVIASDARSPQEVAHPSVLLPVDPKTGVPDVSAPLAGEEEWRLHPELEPEGPVTALLSAASERLVILRNGVEIGRSRIGMQGSPVTGTHAYMAARVDDAEHPGGQGLRWISISTGDGGGPPKALSQQDMHSVSIPPGFRAAVNRIVGPGTTLVVTDQPISPASTGVRLEIANSDAP